MIPILTPRGLVWLSSSLLIPLSGVVLGIPWRDVLLLFIVYWLVVGVAGLFWYVNERRFLKTLSLTGIVPAKCFSNRPEHFSILLRAAPRSYVMEWILTPTLRGEVHAEDLPCAIESPSQNPLCTTPFTINPFGRGEILWNSCAVRWGRKGGLLRFQASVSLRETCISTVYPNILAAQEGSMAMLAAKREGERMAIAVRGEGREFDSLRKYAVGDDPRKIEWKRSARSNTLLVKNYRPESHQRVAIALDCSRRMSSKIGLRTQLDFGCDAAAVLSSLALRGGDEVGVMAFDFEIRKKLECRKGTAHLAQVLETLKDTSGGSLEGDYLLVAEWAKTQKKRALLVLITSLSTPAHVEFLRTIFAPLVGRHLPLVVAIEEKEIEKLALSSPTSLDEAFVAAAAMEQQSAIYQRIRALERSGVECIYGEAQSLAAKLHQKYLSLKQRGKI